MKAVILAGGEGTRLRPLTSNTPKPMMPLANKPMMEHIVSLLALHGFDEIVVTVAFLANQIRDYFGDGSDFDVTMRYATEDTPLGTAGSVRNAADELDDTFLVISGDVLTDIDLTAFVKAHRDAGASASIALKHVENPLEFGIVITQPDGTIERFLEKPTWGEVFSDTINTGIYVLEPVVFDHIPEGQVVDFSSDVFPALLDDGHTLHGHVAEGYWEDVGTLEAYSRVHTDVLDGRVKVEIEGFQLGDRRWIGSDVEISPEARLDDPVVIGDSCRVEAGAHIRPYTVLGTDVIVKADAFLERAVLHDHVYVGPGANLRGCVIGRNTDLRSHVRVDEGTVIGDECFIGQDAVINPNVKVYPFKTVESGAVVTSSIVWESRGARTLFGRRGVRGLANVDINPELAVRLAMAYSTSIPKGATITASRDTSRIARALKRALIAGINLSGANVEDIELATVPLTRFQVRNSRSQGGITVRLAPGDPDTVEIRFFDADGRDIDPGAQRKIERLLYREDYRRAFGGEVGDIVFPPRSLEFYTAALERIVDIDLVRRHSFKIVLDYSFGAASIVMPSLLTKLGAEVLAVNPFASTESATATAEVRDAQVARLADLVRVSGSDVGFVIDPEGELVVVVDDSGHILEPDELLLAVVALIKEAIPGASVAVPVNATSAVERILGSDDSVVRTRLWGTSLMETAAARSVVFAGTPDGGCVWPEFLPAYDAAATLAKVLDLLAAVDRPLSQVVAGLPETHVAHETIVTPWERKGTVMREIVERTGARETELIDGVKVIDGDRWALVLPDPDEALTHVWAEADSDPEARRIAQQYIERIRQVLR
ncbi:MAG TPA: sugar phosphate nucleotidyltransferase [Acidimicrobiia bacterium]|nr:sugar phosphate nucleotidyltransferase [Acidimicrobiia bacterium]